MSRDTSVLDHYLAPLRPHLDAPGVTELVINRPCEFATERAGVWTWHEAHELTADWLAPLAIAAAAVTAQDVTAERPLCATTLPSGERCQIVLPPAAEYLSLTFRKASAGAPSLENLTATGYFEGAVTTVSDLGAAPPSVTPNRDGCDADWPAFFAAAVQGRRNILISGATGSGKTTFAKALVRLIPPDERLVTIEDARELDTPQRNVVHLLYAKDGQGLSQATSHALLEAALRMRPDRVLLQELRDASAYLYLRSCNSGHPGSITTIHANSAELAFEQLILLVKESPTGRDLPRQDVQALLRRLIDVVAHVARDSRGFRLQEVWRRPGSTAPRPKT